MSGVKNRSKQPQKPVAINEETHKQLKKQALKEGVFLYEIIDKAVAMYIESKKKK